MMRCFNGYEAYNFCRILETLPREGLIEECLMLKSDIRDIHTEGRMLLQFIEDMGLLKLFNHYTKDSYKGLSRSNSDKNTLIMLYKIMAKSLLDEDKEGFSITKTIFGREL